MCQNNYPKTYLFKQKDRIQPQQETESPLYTAFLPIFNIQKDSKMNIFG